MYDTVFSVHSVKGLKMHKVEKMKVVSEERSCGGTTWHSFTTMDTAIVYPHSALHSTARGLNCFVYIAVLLKIKAPKAYNSQTNRREL